MLKVALIAGCATTPAQMYFGRPPMSAAAYNPVSYYSAQNCLGCKTDAQTRAEAAQAIEADTISLARRESSQGSNTKRLSDNQCYSLLEGVPGDAFSRGDITGRGVNSLLTPQEQYCIDLGRSHESPANNVFPGMLPEGARAVPTGPGGWLVYW